MVVLGASAWILSRPAGTRVTSSATSDVRPAPTADATPSTDVAPSATVPHSSSQQAAAPAPAGRFSDGEPRQRPEFEAIAQNLFRKSFLFEKGRPERTQERLVQEDLPIAQQLGLQDQLVTFLLQDGRVDEAIAASDTLFRRLVFFPNALEDHPELLRRRGLAYLRMAEVENCIKRHNAECCIFPLAAGGIHSQSHPAAEARRCYENYLRMRPDDLGARWLLNVVTMALGEYPDAVPAEQLISPSAFSSDYDIQRFPDIAARLHLDRLNLCGGCIAEDFDGNGLLDVVVSTIDPLGPMSYYRNVGDGTFEDRSAASRLDDQLGGLNIIANDYDNDGDVDILVLRGAWLFDDGRIRNSLLRNDGQGVFTDVTRRAGIAEPSAPTQAAVWGDFDNDGDLDLYRANESRVDKTMVPPEQQVGGDYSAQLFRNEGNGTFVEIARETGVANDRYAKGVTAGDYDNDGDLDLYVSNFGKNRLYRNRGDGTFIDVAEELHVTEPANRSFTTWFFDYDNDGWLDLFVAAYDATIDDIAADYLGRSHKANAPRLYRNTGGTGKPGFHDVTAEVGLDRPFLPMGANFGDLDNDGYLDMYLTTGDPNYESLMPNIMLRNDKGKRFQDVTESGGFGHLQKGHGVAFADLDEDGDQDIFHQVGGFYRGDAFRNALFHNPGHGNHFITVQLIGTKTNRLGYGARIALELETPHGTRTLHRAVGSVSSFGGSPARQEIGLGDATAIRKLSIHWPVSRSTQVFTDVPLDSFIQVTEGEAHWTTRSMKRIRF